MYKRVRIVNKDNKIIFYCEKVESRFTDSADNYFEETVPDSVCIEEYKNYLIEDTLQALQEYTDSQYRFIVALTNSKTGE